MFRRNFKLFTLFRESQSSRIWGAVACVIALFIGYSSILLDWFKLAISSDLHSHVILIPLISIYLLLTPDKRIDSNFRSSFILGEIVVVCTTIAGIWISPKNLGWSNTDTLAFQLMTFIGFLLGICLFFLGRRWVVSRVFPLGFLLLMIPVPDAVIAYLEQLLMIYSAWLAELIFNFAGVPVFKTGQLLELPGICLEVAQECSGIRSSWVLFITSLLASYLFLPTVPKRILLVFFVFPLAVLRNALRVFVIGWICVTEGPEMVDSWIHKEGGPLFFVASLIPLLILAWFLRNHHGRKASNRSSFCVSSP